MTDSVAGAVAALLPGLAAAAADVDRAGAVPAGSVADLARAGVFTLLQPAGFGGRQADPADYLAVIEAISGACTATGWLAGMLAVNAWHLALFDTAAQRDVWGGDPAALIASSYAPTGRLERTDTGFQLTGRWPRCTGVAHAAWVIVGALIVDADGAAEDFTVALVPRAEVTVQRRWNGLGLRGIGADDVVISGAAVPGHRTFGWVSPDQQRTLAPLYRLPQPVLYNHTGTAPALGAARALLDARPAAAAPLSPAALARSGLELSGLQVRRNLADLLTAGAAPSAELLLRTRRDQVVAFDRAVGAVRALLAEHGADPAVERVWRDLQTARMHVVNDVDRVLAVVGRAAFGQPVDAFML